MEEIIKSYGLKTQDELNEMSDKDVLKLYAELISKLPKKRYDVDEDWPLMGPIPVHFTSRTAKLDQEIERRKCLNKTLPKHKRLSTNPKKVLKSLRKNGQLVKHRAKVSKPVREEGTQENS